MKSSNSSLAVVALAVCVILESVLRPKGLVLSWILAVSATALLFVGVYSLLIPRDTMIQGRTCILLKELGITCWLIAAGLILCPLLS